ncbi:MAG TPA: metalloregulator ArsR/SmtB family transcription factor [Erysipelothrix sp.]
MSLEVHKKPIKLLEMVTLITSAQFYSVDKLKVDDNRINWINQHYNYFYDEHQKLLGDTKEILNRYDEMMRINELVPIGTFVSIIFQSQVLYINELTLEKFTIGSVRSLLLNQYDGDQDTIKRLFQYYDGILSESKLDYINLLKHIELLDCAEAVKYDIVKYFIEIERIYEDFIVLLNEINRVYSKFSEKYQYLIDAKFNQGLYPNHIKDLAVDRFVDLDSFSVHEVENFHFAYSLINYKGQITKLGIDESELFFVQYGILESELEKIEKQDEKKIENIQQQIMALGDHKRFSIFTMLLDKEYYLKEIADSLNLSPSTVSHHMDILTTAGLLRLRSKGKRIYYSINKEEIKRIADYFAAIAD